jgi:hypothetical protein
MIDCDAVATTGMTTEGRDRKAGGAAEDRGGGAEEGESAAAAGTSNSSLVNWYLCCLGVTGARYAEGGEGAGRGMAMAMAGEEGAGVARERGRPR